MAGRSRGKKSGRDAGRVDAAIAECLRSQQLKGLRAAQAATGPLPLGLGDAASENPELHALLGV